MNRKTDTGTCFILELYDEDKERNQIIGTLLACGLKEVVWSRHDMDEAKVHTHVLVRVPYAQTISAFAKRYGARERLIQLAGRDSDHKNYKGAMIYLLHRDKRSIAAGKHQYTESSLFGPWREHALEVIKKHDQVQWKDTDVILVLDEIERREYVKSADLMRWACSVGLYSIYRRNLSAIRDCIREHNDLYRHSDDLEYLKSEVRQLREDREVLNRKIAYADGYMKRDKRVQEQPWRVNIELIEEMLHQGRMNEND